MLRPAQSLVRAQLPRHPVPCAAGRVNTCPAVLRPQAGCCHEKAPDARPGRRWSRRSSSVVVLTSGRPRRGAPPCRRLEMDVPPEPRPEPARALPWRRRRAAVAVVATMALRFGDRRQRRPDRRGRPVRRSGVARTGARLSRRPEFRPALVHRQGRPPTLAHRHEHRGDTIPAGHAGNTGLNTPGPPDNRLDGTARRSPGRRLHLLLVKAALGPGRVIFDKAPPFPRPADHGFQARPWSARPASRPVFRSRRGPLIDSLHGEDPPPAATLHPARASSSISADPCPTSERGRSSRPVRPVTAWRFPSRRWIAFRFQQGGKAGRAALTAGRRDDRRHPPSAPRWRCGVATPRPTAACTAGPTARSGRLRELRMTATEDLLDARIRSRRPPRHGGRTGGPGHGGPVARTPLGTPHDRPRPGRPALRRVARLP